jgi:peptidoglycan-N-acetylglucosamine deacetylase
VRVGEALTWFLPAPAPVFPPAAALYRIERRIESPGVALTFDDGPHPAGTPAVLEILDAAGVSATFFLVGEQVERDTALAGEIAAAGHEVALHGFRHRLLLRRAPRELADDLARATAAIQDATGRTLHWYRPPYGVFSSAGLHLVRGLGLRPLLWSTWGRDWERRATPDSIARRATRALSAGDVVLLHDADHYSVQGSWEKTAAALPRVLEAADRLGLAWVTLERPS